MSAGLLALLLATAPCDHPGARALEPAQRREAACALLAGAEGPPLARPALEAIYARPGFERARQRDSGALQALLARLQQRLLALFETSGAQAYSNTTRVLVLATALAVGLGLALRRVGRRRQAGPAQGPAPEPTRLDPPGLHLARGQAALATAPREALREGLLALLAGLERQGLARPDRARTNRELVNELPGRGAPAALAERVRQLVEAWDAAFYSLRPVSEAEAAAFLARVTPLVLEGPPR